jgi:8-oxo-dGTP diphosphatase
MLAENSEGHQLLRLLPMREQELGELRPLTHARVIARHHGKVLLVFERARRRWELAGGALNPGETARHGAARELREESSNDCRPEELRFVTAFELALAPTHAVREPHTEYGALYEVEIEHIAAFLPTDEISATLWWQGSELSHELDAIDRKLIELVLGAQAHPPPSEAVVP